MSAVLRRITGICCIGGVLAGTAHAELVLHYDFTERAGDVLHDRSGKGHDVRIQGPGWVTTEGGAALDFDAVDDFIDGSNPPGTPDKRRIDSR